MVFGRAQRIARDLLRELGVSPLPCFVLDFATLAHGVPLIVAGRTEDKTEVAGRVAWSGSGIDLRTNTPTPDAMAGAVNRILTEPHFRESAGRLRDELAACTRWRPSNPPWKRQLRVDGGSVDRRAILTRSACPDPAPRRWFAVAPLRNRPPGSILGLRRSFLRFPGGFGCPGWC